MFLGWQTFYQLTGAVAGQLVGLLFIVATLVRGRDSPESQAGQRQFTSPAVVHFAVVVIISALALAPGVDNSSASVMMVVVAIAATAYSVFIGVCIGRRPSVAHWTDIWFYGVAPPVCYAALSAATIAAVARVPHAPYYVGLVLLTPPGAVHPQRLGPCDVAGAANAGRTVRRRRRLVQSLSPVSAPPRLRRSGRWRP